MVTNNATNVATAASGKVLQGAGVGVAPTFSTATYPSTAGTSGNVLTSNGTNWSSSAPTGGSFVFISQNTPSAASDTQFALSGYNNYYVTWYGVSSSSNAVTFQLEVSDDGGSTWKVLLYTGIIMYYNAGGAVPALLATAIPLSGIITHSSTNNGQGQISILNVGTTVTTQFVMSGGYPHSAAAGAMSATVGSGWAPASLTINRIRFLMSTGNISGTFNLYGIKTS